MAKRAKRKLTSATYDAKSGLMQRTLENGNSISVLFGGIGTRREGKKGTYVELPSGLVGYAFPMSVNDGNDTYSGAIRINRYDENYGHGMYWVTFQIGKSKIQKHIKVHDLATLWCMTTTAMSVLKKELRRMEKEEQGIA